jgi:hypothetical protein
MDARAQSNAQLFLQLHRAGASATELRLVRDAYLLAMELYSGLYTGCGKPTLAHEVGTASLAHRYGASIDQVVAALLHGAYLVGDWGHYRTRLTARKRHALRSIIGERAEALVYAYTQHAWEAGTIARLAMRIDSLSEIERDVGLLRLVEELDRFLDYGAILCFRDAAAVKASLPMRRDAMRRLADGLGHPELSAALVDAIDRTLAAEFPPEIMGLRFPGDASFRLVPPSYRKRLDLRAYRAVAGYARRIERELRRHLRPGAAAAEGVPILRRP